MKLFSRICGSGKDIIIIHGLFGMSDNWATFAKRLSQKFKVHCVDIRNHGNSPHSNFFDYDFISEDIINYINQNNIYKPHLLGHSLGGKAVMKLVYVLYLVRHHFNPETSSSSQRLRRQWR